MELPLTILISSGDRMKCVTFLDGFLPGEDGTVSETIPITIEKLADCRLFFISKCPIFATK